MTPQGDEPPGAEPHGNEPHAEIPGDEPQGELDQAARWLERLTGDPMASAVRGRLTVLRASEPTARGRFQECRLELRAEAPGIAPTTVAHTAVFDRRHWPPVGFVVPARIAQSDPRVFEANWDALQRMPRTDRPTGS